MKKWNVGWGPISTCNMNCAFCYSKNVREEQNQLSFFEWEKFINQNHQYINNINYGTGENSMSTDWFRLLKHIHTVDSSIMQGVTTNGFISVVAAQEKNIEQTVVNCISEIDVSLDYSDKEKHNTFRRQRNAYQWVMNTLERFSNSNILLTIVMMGTNDTLEPSNIDGLMKIADRYNTKLRINLYRPTEGITSYTKVFIPDYATILKAIKYINEEYVVLSISDPLFSSILIDDVRGREIDPSGSKSLRILHNGDITPSTYLISKNFRTHNITEDNVLSELFFENDEMWVQTLVPEDCQSCEYAKFCRGGALDRRYLWYKKFDTPDPYCPYREGNGKPNFKLDLNKDTPFTSIHHGYLPTMFFMP